jgi:hypothetical protein
LLTRAPAESEYKSLCESIALFYVFTAAKRRSS